MKTPVPLIEKAIIMHGLNTLAAYDQGERLRLFFAEGTPDELVEHLRDLAHQLEGTFLVKSWKRTPKQSGRRPEAESTYSWHVQGKKEDAPVQGIPGGIPEAVINELAELRAERLVRERLEAERQDEDEDEDEVGDPALNRLVDMLQGLLAPKPPVPAAPVQGAERGHPSALTKERLVRVLAAIRNLHAADPATFDQYEAALIAQYGQRKAS